MTLPLKFRSFLVGLVLGVFLLLVSAPLRADVVHLTITSADYNDGQYYVGPYHSIIAHGDNLVFPAITFCIDFTHHVGFGQGFEVHVVNLADYTGALHDSYWEAGWLTLQLQNTTNLVSISNIQRAIWQITTPGTTDPYLTTADASAWVAQAVANYQSVDQSNFVLYLRSGESGQSQISVVPEPTTYALACAGLISLVGFRRLFHGK